MRRPIGFVVLALVMCAAASARGADLTEGLMGGLGIKFLSEFKPVVGAWAEYRVDVWDEHRTETVDQSQVRLAITGREGEAYWYEMVMHVGGVSDGWFLGQEATIIRDFEGTTVAKMLVSGNPQDPQSVTRVIIKMNDEPAMEMPVTGMAPPPTTGETGVPKQPEGKVVDLGIESVTVPAGTFQARHTQYTSDDTAVDCWVAADIGPYGVVKMTSGDTETVLAAYGTDATTLITETPTKLEMPMIPFGKPKGQ
jgi:hypothetical protein